MCDSRGSPAGVAAALALALLERALDHLNAADVASLPAAVQADALRALGRAEAKHTAARFRLLGAFAAQGGSPQPPKTPGPPPGHLPARSLRLPSPHRDPSVGLAPHPAQ